MFINSPEITSSINQWFLGKKLWQWILLLSYWKWPLQADPNSPNIGKDSLKTLRQPPWMVSLSPGPCPVVNCDWGLSLSSPSMSSRQLSAFTHDIFLRSLFWPFPSFRDWAQRHLHIQDLCVPLRFLLLTYMAPKYTFWMRGQLFLKFEYLAEDLEKECSEVWLHLWCSIKIIYQPRLPQQKGWDDKRLHRSHLWHLCLSEMQLHRSPSCPICILVLLQISHGLQIQC